MPELLVISHPEVAVDPAIPVSDWPLNEIGRRRARAFAQSAVFASVSHVWTSAERKARDTATILAADRSLPTAVDPDLGEHDRSATGFLPPPRFEAAARAFFADPGASFRGWETANDAQARIDATLRRIAAAHAGRDLALVTHGGVGTLLWCARMGVPIDRRHDQPGQGHYWCADLATLRPRHGWRSIA